MHRQLRRSINVHDGEPSLQAPSGLVIRLEMDHRDSGVGTGAYVPVLSDPLNGAL
jgi:hypothetical protein